ncbi:methyltransferase domain-containing protein [Desulfuromonas carbonis]|uniref:class I SAM-dependent methyltransferase n=1 Tax=Desulfuromonas sp. DDH964 TaxID=1823759 RepID=UPI00078C0B10|nr:RsmD family RNA methyltransferase [Desulfuromonas sp. DDH964]AMV71256.1 Spermidine synthase [Desulfuromonas sp. DDH964]
MSRDGYWFEATLARQVLAALARGEAEVELSLDLNRSRSRLRLVDDGLVLDSGRRLERADLEEIAGREARIFYLGDGEGLEILESREDGYCKLVPTAQAPLLEISGVKMHISQGTTPDASAGAMAAAVVRRGDRVLDTCGGLGYAAIAALELGAREVVSVEKSAAVSALRRKNPWSQQLDDPGICLVAGDIEAYIRELATESFDSVIHDPPRFSLAGELYGERFYRELHRVLTRRGRLFHYTGNPQLLRRGSGFVEDAMRRLRSAGFRNLVKVDALMGVRAAK